jgi:hypothetical protein
MKSFIRFIAFASALFVIPQFAQAAPGDLFQNKEAPSPQASTHPGLWFTIKNACAGSAYATVGDEVCLLSIGSATYLTKIRSGYVAKGYSEMFNACAQATDGNGQILFVPAPGMSTDAVLVTVKPDSTVEIPTKFCKMSKK